MGRATIQFTLAVGASQENVDLPDFSVMNDKALGVVHGFAVDAAGVFDKGVVAVRHDMVDLERVDLCDRVPAFGLEVARLMWSSYWLVKPSRRKGARVGRPSWGSPMPCNCLWR